jgi:hypothetical protein
LCTRPPLSVSFFSFINILIKLKNEVSVHSVDRPYGFNH